MGRSSCRSAVIWLLREDHVGVLVNTGRAFIGPAKQAKGEGHECHKNAAWLFLQGKADAVTGYALSDDGKWRQHSWGWDGEYVHETTTARIAYYGFVPKQFPFAMEQIPIREIEAFLVKTSQETEWAFAAAIEGLK